MANSTTFRKPSEYPASSEPKSSSEWTQFLATLEGKIGAIRASLAQLGTERAESALKAQLSGTPNGFATLTEQRVALEGQLESLQLAQQSARSRFAECLRKEDAEKENVRQNKIQSLKRQLLTSAEDFDSSASLMKKSLDRYYALTTDIDALMTAEERRNFLGARSSVGPENSMAFHGLARALGMAIAGRPQHHQPLSRYVRLWTDPPSSPPAPAPEPPRDSLTYRSESETLGQVRPRSAS